MSTKNNVVFALWNLLLTGLVIWLLVGRKSASAMAAPEAAAISDSTTAVVTTPVPRDTVGLKNGRIAFFFMDTLKNRYELVKESSQKLLSAGKSWDSDLKSRGGSIAQRMHELEAKDQTYTTMAEKEADSKAYGELQQAMQQLQGEQERKQQQFDDMQMKVLQEITSEITSYLEEYNKTAGFDYIFSIQDGGQVWVGNKGLDITDDIVNALNARHRAKKAAPAPAKK